MSEETKAAYLRRLGDLRTANAAYDAAGEKMPTDVTIGYVAELDELWRGLTDDEQSEVMGLYLVPPNSPGGRA